MKNYLSIGEVSKICNVGVSSLRYYEKIGILIPAYVNPETSYRYYSLNQLLVVDLILMCIELDIPLKTFSNYLMDTEIVNIEQLCNDAEKIALDKINTINRNLTNIQHLRQQLQSIQHPKEQLQNVSEGIYYITQCDYTELDIITYINNISQMYKDLRNQNIYWLYEQGLCFFNNIIYLFIRINKPLETNCLVIPAHTCNSQILELDELNEQFLNYKNISSEKNKVILCKIIYDVHLSSTKVNFELQTSLDNIIKIIKQ